MESHLLMSSSQATSPENASSRNDGDLLLAQRTHHLLIQFQVRPTSSGGVRAIHFKRHVGLVAALKAVVHFGTPRDRLGRR
jgi:hypothetical protein